MNAMRGILRQLLFAVAPKGLWGPALGCVWVAEGRWKSGSLEQLDHSKPICVPAGKDSITAIGLPASGQARLLKGPSLSGVRPTSEPGRTM